MSNNTEEYILGSSDREIERLAYQHEVWSGVTSGLWDSAGIGYGDKVVDLGCGPGFCTFELSRLVGSEGHVFAIDSSAKFASLLKKKIKLSAPDNISFSQRDVNSPGLSDSSADAVFARWLFCFLETPLAVLGEIKRVLKPGGKLLVIDYFNYLAANVFPEKDALAQLFKAYLQTVTEHGGSYDIGGKLPGMLVREGFEIESLTPFCRIGRPGSKVWKWVQLFNEVSVPKLVEQGVWTNAQKEEFEREWAGAENDPAAFFFTPPMIGIVARKAV